MQNVKLSEFTLWRLARDKGLPRPAVELKGEFGLYPLSNKIIRQLGILYPGVAIDTAVNMMLTDIWRTRRKAVNH